MEKAIICVKCCLEVTEVSIEFGNVEASDPDEQFQWSVEGRSLIRVNRGDER